MHVVIADYAHTYSRPCMWSQLAMLPQVAMQVVTTDLFFVALLGSCCLLGLGFCSPHLLIGVCQLPHQVCLRRAALGSSVLAELALNGGTLSFGSGLH